MKYILGLDLGTTHAKLIAMTPGGDVLHADKQSYEPVPGLSPGYHELYPDEILKASVRLLREAIESLKDHEPVAISISAAMHSLMLVDEKGKPLTNLITWADLRSAPQARQLMAEPGAEQYYQKTGTPVHPMSPLCKIRWFKENHFKLFRQAHKFIGIKEYIVYALCGSWFVDHAIASATGLFNIHDKCWDVSILKKLELSAAQLPVTVPVSYQAPVTNPEITSKFTGGKALVLIAGSSDGALANLGSGAIGENRLSITVGTSGAVRKVVSNRVLDPRSANFCYVFDDKQFLSGGPINNAGNLLKWFSESMSPLSLIEEGIVDSFFPLTARSSEPVFLPYIQGERAPVWDADARGVFVGLRSSHGIEELKQATGESICYSIRQLVDLNDAMHGRSEEIILSGGLSKSAAFVQLLASVLNRAITVSDDADASAVGACVLGWFALKTIDSYEQLLTDITSRQIIPPIDHLVVGHEARYKIFCALYQQNREVMHQLAALDS